MMLSKSQSQVRGFTLIELMIVVIIVAVLLAVALPGFRDLLERNRLQAGATGIYTSLMTARSEALKRNHAVIICHSHTGVSCDPNDPGQWEAGWMVHADPNSPVTPDPNAILLVRERLKAGDTLRVVDDPDDATPTDLNELIFDVNGGASSQAAFILCNADEDTATAREVTLGLTGRPRINLGTTDCAP